MADSRLTRMAPTPSGYLHEGNLFNFILTSLIADEHQARILLRIDDQDESRYREEYAQHIFDVLRYFGLKWDEGPRDLQEFKDRYRQRYRRPLYSQALEKLREGGWLYACECSRREMQQGGGGCVKQCRGRQLKLDRPDVAWRWITPHRTPLMINNYAEEASTTLPGELKDVILRKKDGEAAYQLSSLIDDAHFGVDLIVRGEDLKNSSQLQLALSKPLGLENFQRIQFYHHALILDDQGDKLSKSEGAGSMHSWLQEKRPAADLYRRMSRLLQLPPCRKLKELKQSWRRLSLAEKQQRLG